MEVSFIMPTVSIIGLENQVGGGGMRFSILLTYDFFLPCQFIDIKKNPLLKKLGVILQILWGGGGSPIPLPRID